MRRLIYNDNRILLEDRESILMEVSSPKWVGFLTILANAQAGIAFDALMRDPTFYIGRKGPKSARTVRVEIDNFRRQVAQAGLNIIKSRRPDGTEFRIERCDWQIELSGAQAPQTRDPISGLSVVDLAQHLCWVFETMRAKVAFAGGDVSESLSHQVAALQLSQDTMLNAASYAEISRITYRADRDALHDMRDAAMEFAANDDLNGLVRDIYIPRIKVAYAFQDTSAAIERSNDMSRIIEGYVTSGVDVAGLARVLNTRGVITRRARDDESAIRDFQLATVMAITANDPDLIQVSLFNLLACLEFSDLVTPDLKIMGSEMNYWFCDKFNVGKDSAQCSLLLSQFYVENGDFGAARTAMKRAATLMSGERNLTDMAYFFYCTAHLRLAQADPVTLPAAAQTIRSRLARAGRIYKTVDNIIGTRKVDRLAARLGA